MDSIGLDISLIDQDFYCKELDGCTDEENNTMETYTDMENIMTEMTLWGNTTVMVLHPSIPPSKDIDAITQKDYSNLKIFSDLIETEAQKPFSEAALIWEEGLKFARECFRKLSSKNRLMSLKAIIKILKELLFQRPCEHMKYETLEIFLNKYSKFEKRSTEEKLRLWETANWMHIIFRKNTGIIASADGNKGLSITALSKVLEGEKASYITGTGQTKPTSDRVLIYETEGATEAKKRCRKSKSLVSDEDNSDAKSSTETETEAETETEPEDEIEYERMRCKKMRMESDVGVGQELLLDPTQIIPKLAFGKENYSFTKACNNKASIPLPPIPSLQSSRSSSFYNALANFF